MTKDTPTLPEWCLLGLSAALPWQVYQQIPWLPVDVSGPFALVLAFTAVRQRMQQGRLRIPFELAWPAAVIVVLASVQAIRTSNASGLTGPLYNAALFAAAMQHLRSQRIVQHCMAFLCASGVAVAALTLAAPYVRFFPTAAAESSSAALYFAFTMNSGITLLLLTLAWTLHAALNGNVTRKKFLVAAPAVLIVLACLALILVPLARAPFDWSPPDFAQLPALTLLTALTAAWLGARVCAKLFVDRLERPQGRYLLLVVLLAIIAMMTLAFPQSWQPLYTFVFALAAAYALPTTVHDVPACAEGRRILRVRTAVLYAGLLPLAWFNLTHVGLDNRHDPRNYDAAARALFAQKELGLIVRHMDLVDQYRPVERRTHYWRARVALAEARPHQAAAEFAESLPQAGDPSPLLPPPSAREQDHFLSSLRDYCSALPRPETAFAYEYALTATRQSGQALASLRLRDGLPKTARADSSLPVLVQAAAFALGDGEELRALLGQWSSRDLVQLLRNWGATILPAPPDWPADATPFAAVARFSTRTASVYAVCHEAESSQASSALFAETARGAANTNARWVLSQPSGIPTASLLADASGTGNLFVEVRIENGRLSLPRMQSALDAAPDRPAILVVLPRGVYDENMIKQDSAP